MTRILTPEELATLAQPAGAIAEARSGQPIVAYDFRRPDRVSKDQIRSLNYLRDRFARNAATSLAAFLRTVTEISVVGVEQFAYSDFLMALPDPTAFYAISLSPVESLAALPVGAATAGWLAARTTSMERRPLPARSISPSPGAERGPEGEVSR